MKVRLRALVKQLLYVVVKARLISLQRQHVMPMLFADLGGIYFWQSIASMVTAELLMFNSFSSLGIAVISFDFSSQATCPSVSLFSQYQAVSRCSTARPMRLRAYRMNVLPSKATSFPPIASSSDCVKRNKQVGNGLRSSRISTHQTSPVLRAAYVIVDYCHHRLFQAFAWFGSILSKSSTQ